MKPCVHMSGFLGKTDFTVYQESFLVWPNMEDVTRYIGQTVQNFDVSQFYAKDDTRDLLIRNKHLGAHFADYFSHSGKTLRESVVLMRGHGFTAVGGSIEESVFRAVYTAENASVQTTAIMINTMGRPRERQDREVNYLQDSELYDTTEMTKWSVMRPWRLWLREVETSGLYANRT